MPSLRDGNIPRFLFRIHTPNCYGHTSLSSVMPQACIQDGFRARQDIFTWNRQEAAKILNVHLRWWNYDDPVDCDLVCWTSSLLFALQYGLHRARSGNPDGHDPSQITLMIIDTQDMPKAAFVKDLDIIDSFLAYSDHHVQRNLADLQQLRLGSMGYYFGEYPSQGYLDIEGKCSQATMQELIDSGLFRLMPEMEGKDSRNRWANRVIELRRPFNETVNLNQTKNSDVRRAIVIAERCFPGRWAFPAAIMLLALRPCLHKDRIILDTFASMYSGELYASASAMVTGCTESSQQKRCDAYRCTISRLMQHGYLKSSNSGDY
jgi:hypothetical protein